MRRHLSGRVALLALGVLAAWLLALLVGLNIFVPHRLNADLDNAVRVRAQAVLTTVTVVDDHVTGVHDSTNDQQLDDNVWVVADGAVVDGPGGAVTVSSVVLAAAQSRTGFIDVPGKDVRLYVQPITATDHTRIGAVVAAASTASAERAGTFTLVGSIIVGALLLLGAYPVLRLTASKALRPVEEMTRQAAAWSIDDPSRRFGERQRYTEISSLAHSLDALLDRLAGVLRHERTVSAEISHELRTPLTHILAETELLQRGRDAQPAGLARIHESAQRMQRIIETLLASSRIEHSADQGRAVVAEVLSAVIAGLPPNAAPVSIDVDPDLHVGVDEQMAERILMPVLANAARLAASHIDVIARSEDGRVVVEVGNDGPRIESGHEEEIFRPGFRTADPQGHDGAGLGLPLARRLARAVDGDVWLASADPVSFTIALPG